MTPVKPRPLLVPQTSTSWPSSKNSEGLSAWPTEYLASFSAADAELADFLGGLLVELLEEAGFRLGDALLALLTEAEDQGGVAVLLRGALAEHDAGTALDGGDAVDHAFGVKDLSVSELFADQAEIGIHRQHVPLARRGRKIYGRLPFVKAPARFCVRCQSDAAGSLAA